MKLASLAFVAVLLIAHLAGDPGERLARLALPLSMFRHGSYGFFGCLLFGLLLVIAGLMLSRLHRACLHGDACVLGVVTTFLLLVAVTPSDNGFHIFGSFAVLALLFCYYAAVLHGEGAVWMWGHLAFPVLLVLGTRCHSYGLWQKSLIVYFVLAVNVQHWMLSRGRTTLSATRRGRHDSPGGHLRRRVVYVVETGQSWSRNSDRQADRTHTYMATAVKARTLISSPDSSSPPGLG